MTYTVQSRLGRGGMGVVDLALDERGRPVALKRLGLHGSAREMAAARQRIRREAEVLRMLDHPAVVRLLAVDDDGEDVVLVMPYLEGGTLVDHVRTRGPLHPAQVHLLADRLLGALAAAHRLGIVHRDIKPGNVLFDEQGLAHLADFGVASLRDATSGLTATGSLVGTPDYMAPEQARGERATPASDVFSLGATLLFAATGQPPYGTTDSRLTIDRAARGRMAPLPATLDPELRRRLRPMLQRDQRRRPAAAELSPGPAGTVVAGPRRRPAPPRWTRLAVGGAALVGATAVLAGVGAYATSQLDLRLGAPAEADQAAAADPTPPCTPKPYQPCGAPVAPNTDGTECVGGHADYDGDARNGCEAAPDDRDGTLLTKELTANLVPADDVDRYPLEVVDKLHLTCDGTLDVTLTAPAGTTMELAVLEGTEVLGRARSSDGEPARVRLLEPSCLGDDSTTLTAQVSWVGPERSAAAYTLARRGSY